MLYTAYMQHKHMIEGFAKPAPKSTNPLSSPPVSSDPSTT